MSRISTTLVFELNNQETEWRYDQSRVSCEASLNNYVATLQFLEDTLKEIRHWMGYVGIAPFNNTTVESTVSGGFKEEIKDENGTIKWEAEIGDLEVKLVYNKNAQTYTWDRSAFDLSWTDFKIFIDELEGFLNNYMKQI